VEHGLGPEWAYTDSCHYPQDTHEISYNRDQDAQDVLSSDAQPLFFLPQAVSRTCSASNESRIVKVLVCALVEHNLRGSGLAMAYSEVS